MAGINSDEYAPDHDYKSGICQNCGHIMGYRADECEAR
jgi:hypothetical protein